MGIWYKLGLYEMDNGYLGLYEINRIWILIKKLEIKMDRSIKEAYLSFKYAYWNKNNKILVFYNLLFWIYLRGIIMFIFLKDNSWLYFLMVENIIKILKYLI